MRAPLQLVLAVLLRQADCMDVCTQTVWLLWSGYSMRAESVWVMGLVQELDEEREEDAKLLEEQRLSARDDVRNEGVVGDIEEAGKGRRGRQVDNLRKVLKKRQAMFDGIYPKVVQGFIAISIASCALTAYWAQSGSTPACTTWGAGGGQVWPVFVAPTGS